MRCLHPGMRRRYRGMTLLMVVALLLSSCVTATTDPPAIHSAPGIAEASAVRLSFGAFESERRGYQPLIDVFNQSHPGIHVQFVALDDLYRVSPGQSGADDRSAQLRAIVSRVDTAAEFVDPALYQLGLLHDLKPFMDADASFAANDFYPHVLQSVTTDGGLFVLPATVHIQLLSYNKALWAAQGLPAPAPDWSWQDLEAAAQQLAQRNGSTVSVYGVVDSVVLYRTLLAELDLASTTLDQLRFDRLEIATALEHIAGMVNAGAVYNWSFDQPNWNELDHLVLDQKAGMWSADIPSAKGTTAQPAFEIGTAAYPASTIPGLRPFDVRGYLMSAGTQHPNEAWTWLSYLSKQVAPSEKGPEPLPARQSIVQQSGYWSSVDAETAAAMQATLAHPLSNAAPNAFDDPRLFAPLAAALAEVIGGRPAAQALQEAQRALADVVATISVIPTPTPDPRPLVVAPPAPDVAPAGATTITFAVPQKGADQLQQLAQQFNQGNASVFVRVVGNDPQRERPSLTELAASADCFISFAPPTTSDVSATLDLQPLIDGDASFSLDDYPPQLLAPYRQAGHLTGLPIQVGFLTVNYNQDAFAAAGLALPTASWTLDDFLNAAEQLTDGAEPHSRYGFAMPRNPARIIRFLIGLSQARLTVGSGPNLRPNFTDASVTEATGAVIDLVRHTSPHTQLDEAATTGTDSRPYDALVAGGRIGMWLGNGWQPYGGAPAFSLQLVPPPLHGAILTSDAFFSIGTHISAQSANHAACWTWLKYLSAAPTNLLGGSPARRSIALSDAFKAVLPGAAESYRAYDAAFQSNDAVMAAEEAIDYRWFDRAVDHALQGKDLERELAAAQTLTEQFLACEAAGAAAATCATQVDPEYQELPRP